MEVIISDPADFLLLSNRNHQASKMITIYHIPFEVLQNYADESELVKFNLEVVNPIHFNEIDKVEIRKLHFNIGACTTMLDCSIIYSAQIYKHCIVTSQNLIFKIAIEFNLNVIMTSDFCNQYNQLNQSISRTDLFRKSTIKTKDII
jgi:hypothetical protein